MPKPWMSPAVEETRPLPDAELLSAARSGDSAAFDRLAARYRGELYAHCYRMLASVQDAEDALQEALLAAWRGLGGFAGHGSLRAWLYRITTNVCLRLIARRSRRMSSREYGPAVRDPHNLGSPVTDRLWLEPLPDELAAGETDPGDPSASYGRRESVELAFVAALQHLPGRQRAVLILREVLGFSAAEVARTLDTTPAAVHSALQRARKTVEQHMPTTSQQAELASLGDRRQRQLVDAFVAAWERADVAGLMHLLAEDASFSMPPLPAWFSGRDDIRRFVVERMFATPWRLRPVRANGQLAFACYQGQPDGDTLRLGAINVLGIRGGLIADITAFLDPSLHRHFGLPEAMNFGPPTSVIEHDT